MSLTTPEVSEAERVYRRAWRKAFRPDPLMTISEWADQYRKLSSRASAEPGQWRTRRTPYLKEIMDCLSPSSPVERVVFQKGVQIGATEAGNNWLGFVIHKAPGPILSVMPTVEMAKRTSKQRIAPMIEETPVLDALVENPRRRDSGNTVLSKEFPGGVLIMTGANSAVGLRSMPARYLFLDEVDGYPADADGEGDPIELAVQRTRTFARRKIFLVSTPTITGLSRIEAAFEESDQRRLHLPCPDCGHMQVLQWANVQWPKDQPEEAAYACDGCGVLIPHAKKQWMLERGQWRAEAEGDGLTAGFHLSSLYSPPGWYSWAQAAKDFLAAKDYPERLKSWVNLCLAETWSERGDAPDWQRLFDRAEDWQLGRVPLGGLYLTAGVDVQKDRLEAEVVAWGPNMESWSVDYRIIAGNPYEAEVWAELSQLLDAPFQHEAGGILKIGRLAIDSGFCTSQVYSWARRQSARQVMAVKGNPKSSVVLGSPSPVTVNAAGRKVASGKVWPIGVNILKGELYGRLRLERPDDGGAFPPGFCHFPQHGEEYFKQLTAEQLVTTKNKRGYPVREWVKTRPQNEALDCRVYAMAAAIAAGIERWQPERWARIAKALGVRAETPEEETAPQRAHEAPTEPTAKSKPGPTVIRSKFMEGRS
ncbi:MAG: phage terminase large subunit family protein [Pseudomonadota bacterium]